MMMLLSTGTRNKPAVNANFNSDDKQNTIPLGTFGENIPKEVHVFINN